MDNLAQLCHAQGPPSAPPVEHYLTVPEVAELLRLSEKTVYRLAQKGELPGFKAGGSWRFRQQDLDAWAAGLVGRKNPRVNEA